MPVWRRRRRVVLNSRPRKSRSLTSLVVISLLAISLGMGEALAQFWGLQQTTGVISAAPAQALTGSLTITKDGRPDDVQEFAFEGDLGNFLLDDDPRDPGLQNETTFSDLAPGTYVVTEQETPGWALNINCIDPDGDSSVDEGSRSATVDLDPGEHVSCTFTNTRLDFPIHRGPSSEPYVAVNPTKPNHVVIGFNRFENGFSSVTCGWAESRDGGHSWAVGSVSFRPEVTPLGDPWVQYSSTGQLFYSCLGIRGFVNKTVGVYVARAESGLAIDLDFRTVQPLAIGQCADPALTETCLEGTFTDHPSITVLSLPDSHSRLVACWVDFFIRRPPQPQGGAFVEVASSDDGGRTWVGRRVLAGPGAQSCTVSGRSSVVATWWNAREGQLEYRVSRDGLEWTRTRDLASVGELVPVCKTDGGVVPCSTTTRVVSLPYGIGLEGERGLQIAYQVRDGDHGQVFLADIEGTGRSAIAIGSEEAETFLPGAGTCPQMVGAYEARSPSRGFRYSIWVGTWAEDGSGFAERLFESSAELNGADGYQDDRFEVRRIGDYTGIGCAGDVLWAAWTDTRSGEPQLWGAVLRFV